MRHSNSKFCGSRFVAPGRITNHEMGSLRAIVFKPSHGDPTCGWGLIWASLSDAFHPKSATEYVAHLKQKGLL